MPFIQSKVFAQNAASPAAAAFTANVTAGSLLLIGIAIDLNATCTVSDNVNGAWTAMGTNSGTPGGFRNRQFYLKNALAGATTVTVTVAGSSINAVMMEWGGADTTAPFDQTAFAQGTSAAPNSTAA